MIPSKENSLVKILRRFLTSSQNLKVPLAFVAGTAIGVAGGWSTHAQQAATTPAFIVSEADEITDSTKVAAYGSKVGATLAPFAGHYHFVMAGGTPHTLDGFDAPKGLVAIAFDSAEQAGLVRLSRLSGYPPAAARLRERAHVCRGRSLAVSERYFDGRSFDGISQQGWLMKILKRFLALTHEFRTGRHDDQRLREELEEHLRLQTAENLRAGMPPSEARRQAILKFGGVGTVREDYHAEASLPFFETLLLFCKTVGRGTLLYQGTAKV